MPSLSLQNETYYQIFISIFNIFQILKSSFEYFILALILKLG